MNYRVYFDAGHLDGRDLTFVIAASFFILCGVGMVLIRKRLNIQKFFPFLFLGISLVIGSCMTGGIWLGKQTGLANKLRLNQTEIIEGAVTDFQPRPAGGGAESFAVGGRRFQYSNDVSSSSHGFSETASRGGPIRNGLKVRIHHVDGVIARLEIEQVSE